MTNILLVFLPILGTLIGVATAWLVARTGFIQARIGKIQAQNSATTEAMNLANFFSSQLKDMRQMQAEREVAQLKTEQTLRERVALLEDRCNKQELEIARLKAQLWDYQNKHP